MVRQAFSHSVPLKTLVICCFDPRVAHIPQLVAERLGDRRNVFPIIVASGRALDALRSDAVGQPLSDIENIVVVHHSQYGATTAKQRVDISHAFSREALWISDFEQSLKSDVALLRNHPAVPRSAAIFGFFFEIDGGALIEMVQDVGGEK